MNRILIAEDELGISSFVDKALSASGFTTHVVTDGETAFVAAQTGEFDLMVLDLGLPRRDGLSVLKLLRDNACKLPVIILTARGGVDHTVAGLELGADDYMTKPFKVEELVARVRVRLRDAGSGEPTRLEAGDVTLDLRSRRVTVDGKSVELTAREFLLLEIFMRHPGQVLSREQLLSRVWGYDFDPSSNVVDVYVRYLRKKLRDDVITTVRGMGYRLDASRTSP